MVQLTILVHGGYWQVPLAPEAREKMAFTLGMGLEYGFGNSG